MLSQNYMLKNKLKYFNGFKSKSQTFFTFHENSKYYPTFT